MMHKTLEHSQSKDLLVIMGSLLFENYILIQISVRLSVLRIKHYNNPDIKPN